MYDRIAYAAFIARNPGYQSAWQEAHPLYKSDWRACNARPGTALAACRLALESGPLVAHNIAQGNRRIMFYRMSTIRPWSRNRHRGTYLRKGRRLFNVSTVNKIIAAGDAQRIGNMVVKLNGGPR